MPLTKVKKDVIQNLNANKVTGTFGANDGSALLGIAAIDHQLRYNLSQNFFNDSVKDSLNRYALDQGWIDTFEDTDDVDGEGVSVPMVLLSGSDRMSTTTTPSNGKEFTVSFWCDMNETTDGSTITFCSVDNDKFRIRRSANGFVEVLLGSSSSSLGTFRSTNTVTVSDGLVHFLISINMVNANPVEIKMSSQNNTETVVGGTPTNIDINIDQANFYLFSDLGSFSIAKCSIGQFYLAEEYIDLSVQANRELFYKDGPVDFGSNGSKPTGSSPIIYLNNPYGSFQTNLGSGGNFSVTGELVDGGYITDKIYDSSADSFSNSSELIDSYGKENADTDVALNAHNSNVQQMFVGQCVTFTTAVSITKLAFEMSDSTGSGTGDVWAVIMGTTGTVGSTAVGDGNILAKSDHLDAGTLTTSASIQTFTFAEPIVLPAGDYFLGMSGQDTGTSSVHWAEVRSDNSSPTHSGNLARYNNPTSAWVADSGADCIFYAYGLKNLDLITKGSDDIGNSPSTAPEKGHMEVLLTEQPAGSSIEWSDTLDANAGQAGADHSFRQIIKASDLANSGNRVRIRLEGPSATGPTVFDNVAIVERSGETAHGVRIPTEILFGGASGVTVPMGGSVLSDWIDFELDATKDYLVVFDMTSTASETLARYTTSGGNGYYNATADNSYNTAELDGTGYSFNANRTIFINQLEVETQQTLGTDIITEMSRDGGSTWDTVLMTRTSTNVSDTSNNILAGNTIFAATAGTNIVGRVRTANKDKITVQGISVNWS